MKAQNNSNLSNNELKTLKELGDMRTQENQNQITGLKSFMNKLNS